MEENIIKINRTSPSISKLILLKKIKLKKFPELSKDLKEFFWNRDKYFEPKTKDYLIIVGNNKTKKTKTPLGNKRKAERRKTRKFINISFNSPDKKQSNDSKANSSRLDRKRGFTKNIKETGLKIGQKYINDYEIEDLFNAFQTAQKINKKRSFNFVFPMDYIDKNSLILTSKTSTNLNKFLTEKKISNEKLPIYNENKKSKDFGKEGNGKILTKIKNNIMNDLNNINTINNDYYKTASTFGTLNNYKDTKTDNIIDSPSRDINKFCSIEKMNSLYNPINCDFNQILNKKSKTGNYFYSLNNIEEKKLIERNKIIRRQNQFLINSKDEENFSKTKKIYFGQILANQENTLSKTLKDKIKNNNFYNILSKKLHKSKNTLLMTNLDSYRIKNELKDKFTTLNSKLEPVHNYNWAKDLREQSKTIKINDNNTTYYNIRDPFSKIIYNSTTNKSLGKKKNMKYFKNLIDESNNINNNLEGLYIKGKNLLKIEYDQVKAIKNKKIINNYEMYLPSADVEDILFTDQKYINNQRSIQINE